ncbi:putative anthocyanidin reductase [Argentina anserina]|uniref:putative anthocyanidin reductase n=1 Tax=Argentina anserina TaxID=57926 RepID=UPI002176408B|nr:putative anthocyanidin reductase [Potentilla anserina]
MEGSECEDNKNGAPAVYCVTGATGYIGSWLVKTLLERGHSVHATVRDPDKCVHLLSSLTGTDRLRLYRADLREEGSFDEAVKGCDGVFHVAASMQFSFPEEEKCESYVQSNIINPAIKGTLDLLKSCRKSGTVNRVVLTSSISTMTAKDSSGNPISVVDESCKTPVDRVWDAKASGWVYALSKILTEEAAFRFASENGIDLVSVITSTVGGPFLTSTVPSSIRVLLSPLTGDSELYGILSAVNARMGSIALVHIEDICDAHIFLMEHDEAEGKYICAAQSCPISELVHYLAQAYPSSNLKSVVLEEEQNNPVPSKICSKKLRDMGFSYKHDIEDIIHQSVSSCMHFGLLPRIAE